MPNWCDNSVRLTHSDKSKVDALEVVLQSEDKEVFQHLRPRPESEKDNWYDWNINNWGTKWELSLIDWDREDDNTVWIGFNSAWSPPISIYEYLIEQGWVVEALYHESGMSYAGQYTNDGGDDYYEYDIDNLEELEALPNDIQEFTGLIDWYHDRQADREQEEHEEKCTDWFDGKVKPVRDGIYEVKVEQEFYWPFTKYINWNGKKWLDDEGNKVKVYSWRGLKEDPSVLTEEVTTK